MRRSRAVLALVLTLAAVLVLSQCGSPVNDSTAPGSGSTTLAGRTGDAVLAQAFEKRAHDLQVQGRGTVVRVLKDDTEGGRHQRFIVKLDSGQTLLIAHNIDVAPRVEDLQRGDVVEFRGVYEWNEEGGTIHWTHADPEGLHEPGWIRHNGRMYQ